MSEHDDSTGSNVAAEAPRLEKISNDLLGPFVQKTLQADAGEVTHWKYEILKGGWTPPESLVCRFSGQARTAGEELPWSLILKILPPTSAARDPVNREPFQRELLVMESGILERMPGLIAGPRYLGTTEVPGDEPWIWMEDVRAEPSSEWPLHRFRTCACHMGFMKGHFLRENFRPEDPRLDLGERLKQDIDACRERAAPFFDEFSKHAMTKELSRTDFGRRVWRLRKERENLFEAILRLPLSMSHGDFCYPNLFSRILADGRDQTVLVDWQYAGLRQIGSDMAPFVSDCTMHPRFRRAAEPRDFLELIVDGFQSGLEKSGWRGDLRIARFTILARLSVVTGSHHLAGLWNRVLRHRPTDENRSQLEAAVGQFVDRYSFLLETADEAGELLEAIA